MNMTWEDVCHEATDRREWKEWTARCAPSTGRTKGLRGAPTTADYML